MKIETIAVHGGRRPDPATGAVREPAVPVDDVRARGRRLVPARTLVRTHEHAKPQLTRAGARGARGRRRGARVRVGFRGHAAAFALATPGGRVVCSQDCYHGTGQQLARPAAALERRGRVRRHHLPRRGRARARTRHVAAVGRDAVESVAEGQRYRGARRRRAFAVHCSVATTPSAARCLQSPFALGADLVMHSTTKYLGGHSDVLGGVLIVRERGERSTACAISRCPAAPLPSPLDCWLVSRSLATLPLRVRAQAANALAVAQFLAADRARRARALSGLESHPAHALARRQMRDGFGGCCRSRCRAAKKTPWLSWPARAPHARHESRRRRKPHRAPCIGRGSAYDDAAKPDPAVDRSRECRGPHRGPRRGARPAVTRRA